MQIKDVENLKTWLRGQEWDRAVKELLKYINQLTKKLQDISVGNPGVIEEFNQIMSMIEKAISLQDVILLCDMIEYELYPFTRRYNAGEGM